MVYSAAFAKEHTSGSIRSASSWASWFQQSPSLVGVVKPGYAVTSLAIGSVIYLLMGCRAY